MHKTAKITLSLSALCLVTMFSAIFINRMAGYFVPQSWLYIIHDIAGILGGTSFLMLIGLITFMFAYPSRRQGASTVEEKEMMCLLAKQAQELTQRMEALETLLLDRTRATR